MKQASVRTIAFARAHTGPGAATRTPRGEPAARTRRANPAQLHATSTPTPPLIRSLAGGMTSIAYWRNRRARPRSDAPCAFTETSRAARTLSRRQTACTNAPEPPAPPSRTHRAALADVFRSTRQVPRLEPRGRSSLAPARPAVPSHPPPTPPARAAPRLPGPRAADPPYVPPIVSRETAALRSASTISAPRSAIINVGEFVFPDVINGITDASITLSP